MFHHAFYLACILYCVCFNLFCNVWVCVCVGFAMCGYFDNCVGVVVKCVHLNLLCFCIVCTVFLYCCVYVHLLFVTSVRTTATE
jgi:hypothetical protein